MHKNEQRAYSNNASPRIVSGATKKADAIISHLPSFLILYQRKIAKQFSVKHPVQK
jgi:hypothetical protein